MTKPYNMLDLKGIGGWLYSVAISVLATLTYMFSGFSEYPSLITSASFSFFSFTQKTLIWSEAIFLATMTLVMAYVAYLFFTKRREFPSWFINTYLVIILYGIADGALSAIFLSEFISEADTTNSLSIIFKQMLGAAVWITYMFKSERVRLTFVED